MGQPARELESALTSLGMSTRCVQLKKTGGNLKQKNNQKNCSTHLQGTCYMKRGKVSKSDAFYTGDFKTVCGIV